MFLIVVISLIIYIIAGVMIYHNVYNFEKSNKIKIIVIGFIITFIITVVICTISSSSINTNTNYLSIAKNTAILLFAPINAIITIPYLGNILNKYKDKRIDETGLKKRLLIFCVILIIVVIFEVGYIKDFEMGLITSAINSAK